MNIIVNGKSLVTTATTLAELAQLQGLENKRFAIEVNEQLVPKRKLSEVILTDGMKIEIVVAVGGG